MSTVALKNNHLVGSDGFIVPANGQEFRERYPDYVAKILRAKGHPINPTAQLLSAEECNRIEADVTTWVAERVSRYTPERSYGYVSAARFFDWIKLLLFNRYFTLLNRLELHDCIIREQATLNDLNATLGLQ